MSNAAKKTPSRLIIRIAVILLVAAAAYFYATQKRYNAMIVAYCGIYAIGITGLDLLFGYTGQISFGHAGFFAIGAYTSALLCKHFHMHPILTMIIGMVFAVIIGLVIALPATKLVKHFLSLLTIAFGQIIYLIICSSYDLTGGTTGTAVVSKIPLGFTVVDTKIEFAVFIWAIAILSFIVKNNIVKSRVGYAFLAVKENTVAANGLGVNTRKYKMMAFALSAAYMALAGGLYAHMVGFVGPDSFSAATSQLFMVMLLFGGTCTLAGPIIGAVFLIIVREVLQAFSNYQVLIYGIFLLAVLFFFPSGIVGLFKKAGDAIRRAGKKGTADLSGKEAA